MPENFALVWDEDGAKKYETGVDKGVLFPMSEGAYGNGVAWNGLSSVKENPTGAEATEIFANNGTYLALYSAEKFEGSISAYTYPDEFEQCDGSAELVPGVTVKQQRRVPFGFSYRTLIGNDTQGTDYGYKIHLVYGATATPSESEHNTVNDTPEVATMSWNFKTVPAKIEGKKPSAHIIIDSTKFTTPEAKTKLASFEAILYGGTAASRLPLPNELESLFKAAQG